MRRLFIRFFVILNFQWVLPTPFAHHCDTRTTDEEGRLWGQVVWVPVTVASLRTEFFTRSKGAPTQNTGLERSKGLNETCQYEEETRHKFSRYGPLTVQNVASPSQNKLCLINIHTTKSFFLFAFQAVSEFFFCNYFNGKCHSLRLICSINIL